MRILHPAPLIVEQLLQHLSVQLMRPPIRILHLAHQKLRVRAHRVPLRLATFISNPPPKWRRDSEALHGRVVKASNS